MPTNTETARRKCYLYRDPDTAGGWQAWSVYDALGKRVGAITKAPDSLLRNTFCYASTLTDSGRCATLTECCESIMGSIATSIVWG
jgi:hypothetical protein